MIMMTSASHTLYPSLGSPAEGKPAGLTQGATVGTGGVDMMLGVQLS